MTGVLRVTQFGQTTTDEEVMNIFQSNNICPLDVHWVMNYGKKTGTAFITFYTKDLRKAESLNEIQFRGNRIIIHPSSHAEFNDYFPSTPMVRNTEWRKNIQTQNYISNSTEGNSRNGSYYTQNDSYSYGNGRNYYGKYNKDNAASYTSSMSYNERQDDLQSTYRARTPRKDNVYDNEFAYTTKESQRSRSPHNKRIVEDTRKEIRKKSSSPVKKPVKETPAKEKNDVGVNEKKYVRIFGMSFTSSADDFKKFLKPLQVKEIYLLKFKSGDNGGKPNGSAIVEMTKEKYASEALGYDGKNFNSRPIQVVRTAKDDIVAAIEDKKKSSSILNADLGTLNNLANSNPQIQRLLGLLNDAVADATKPKESSSSQGKSSSSKDDSDRKRFTNANKNSNNSSNRKDLQRASTSNSSSSSLRSSSGRNSTRNKDNPVINRVASSANINVDDIKQSKVVGMRNLPSHVDEYMILDFFVGYRKINDSVRIHYLESGRCSGDAIITFHTTEEARRAVQNLNKKSVDGRKIELFFL